MRRIIATVLLLTAIFVSGCGSAPSAAPPGAKQWRDAQGRCLIKAHVGVSGEKIYHLPGQRYYAVTQRGVRYYCTEEEAQRDGYRPSKV